MSEMAYFPPPDGYESPSKAGCRRDGCGDMIIYGGVVGGHKWRHLTRPTTEHEVVMPGPWWDVSTGQWVEGPDGPDLTETLSLDAHAPSDTPPGRTSRERSARGLRPRTAASPRLLGWRGLSPPTGPLPGYPPRPVRHHPPTRGGAMTMTEAEKDDLLYEAWVVIANAPVGGSWAPLNDGKEGEWIEAAKRWRDRWHETLPSPPTPRPEEEP